VRDSSGIVLLRKHSDNLDDLLENHRLSDASELIEWLNECRGLVAIDIGANRGQTSIAMSRNFEKVYALEPHLINFVDLRDSLDLNGCHNVEAIQIAATDMSGFTSLNVSTDYGHHSLEPIHISQFCETQTVESICLDDFAERYGLPRINLVKIDVEGHELSVLKGASRLLTSALIDQLIFEHSPVLLDLADRSRSEVLEFLNTHGYQVFDLNGNHIDRAHVMTMPQVDLLAIKGK
jgi:FkbM family methyltransferase